MKTLLFTLEYPPFYGGIANYYGNLIKFWPKPDSIFILHNNQGKLINNKLPCLKWLPALTSLYQTIKAEKINHIIVGHILPLGTAAWLIKLIIGTPYSVILHGMDFAYCQRSWRKNRLALKILNKADNIICANNYLAEQVKNFINPITCRKVLHPTASTTYYYGNPAAETVEHSSNRVNKTSADKIIVVNPGITLARSANNNLINKLKSAYSLKNKIILFSLGRLVLRKGFDQVIELMPELQKDYPDLYYFIAGAGPDETLLKELAHKNEHIIFLDQISDEEKQAWLNLCDIFIMPSRNIAGDYEGFGIVYLEANLCAKPVIAGNSGGVTDAVIDGLNGLLVDPLNRNQIAQTIIKLIQNPALRQKLGQQGKERVLREFSWQKQIRLLYEFITNK